MKLSSLSGVMLLLASAGGLWGDGGGGGTSFASTALVGIIASFTSTARFGVGTSFSSTTLVGTLAMGFIVNGVGGASFTKSEVSRLGETRETVYRFLNRREAGDALDRVYDGIARRRAAGNTVQLVLSRQMHREARDILSLPDNQRPNQKDFESKYYISTAFASIRKLMQKFYVDEATGRLHILDAAYDDLIVAHPDDIWDLVDRALDRMGGTAERVQDIVRNIAEHEKHFVKGDLVNALFVASQLRVPPDSPIATPSRHGRGRVRGTPNLSFATPSGRAPPSSHFGSQRRQDSRPRMSSTRLNPRGVFGERGTSSSRRALSQHDLDHLASERESTNDRISRVVPNVERMFSEAMETVERLHERELNGYENHREAYVFGSPRGRTFSSESIYRNPRGSNGGIPPRERAHSTNSTNYDGYYDGSFPTADEGFNHPMHEQSERHEAALPRDLPERTLPHDVDSTEEVHTDNPTTGCVRAPEQANHATTRFEQRSEEEHANLTTGYTYTNPAIRRGMTSSEYASLPPSSESEDAPTDRPHPDYHFASRLQEEEDRLAGPRFTGTNPSATADDDEKEDSKPKAVPLPPRPVPPSPATQPLPPPPSTSAAQPPATNFARGSTTAAPPPPPATAVASSPPPPSIGPNPFLGSTLPSTVASIFPRASFGANSATTEATEALTLSSAIPPASAPPSDVPHTVPFPASATEASTSATIDSFPSDPPDSYYNEDDVEDVQDVLKFCLHTVQEKGGEEEDAELMVQEKKSWECGKCGHSNAGDGAFCTNEILDKDGKPKRCYGCKKHEGSPKGWAGCFKGVRGKFFLFSNFYVLIIEISNN
jgi:hypothetical protein